MKKTYAMAALLLALVFILTGCGSQGPLDGIPNPIATIELSNGTSMRFELFVQDAPNTVANFVQLANSGFYDGQAFFRVVPGVLVQAGDPHNDGTGGAGHVIQGEFEANGIKNNIAHTRGTLSMARQSGYDTASSQFFIMQNNYPEYNGQYAAFGRAMDQESLAAIDKLSTQPVDSSYAPVGGMVKIVSIRVETHGFSYEAAHIEPEEDEKDKQDKKNGK